MKEIIFPGLKLDFKVNSIAISIFNMEIYWYAIFIVGAFALAIFMLKRENGKYNIKWENVLELLLIIIPISIICARIYFVIFKLDYYLQNPIEIFKIKNGGLAIYGGMIGSIITIIIYAKYRKIHVFDILDYIVPYLPLRSSNRKMGKFF